MIKSTELRIGNKLQKDNGEIFTVLRLDNTNDVLVEEQRGLLTLNYNLIGIPLTEEILLKAGFVRNNLAEKNHWDYKQDSKGISMECTDTWFGVSNDNYDDELMLLHIKYLHQLQNLYWCLCGEELTINL